MTNKPSSRKSNIVVQELEKELLIYDLSNNKAYCLNETAATVWNHCDGRKSLAQIAAGLAERSKEPVPEELVYLALDGLRKVDLLENSMEPSGQFKSMDRRALIKKIGLATAVALPVVSAIIAPTALGAASFIGLGGACTTSPQCANNNCVANTLFGRNPACCVPGATDTIQPGLTYLACNTTTSQTTCNNSASICCSNSGTLTQGACAPGSRTCRCDPFP